MTPIRTARLFVLAAAALLPSVAGAQSILDSWKTVQIPEPPATLPVTVDSKTTALLILDMYATSCSLKERPSCVKTLPNVQRLLAKARVHKLAVIYGAGIASANGPSEPHEALKRLPGEPTARGPADKFVGSELDNLLKARGIKTVIVVGTSADGAVLYTGSDASLRGYKVVVPVDGISSKEPFAELYTVYHLKNSTASVMRNVTLTRTDLITMS